MHKGLSYGAKTIPLVFEPGLPDPEPTLRRAKKKDLRSCVVEVVNLNHLPAGWEAQPNYVYIGSADTARGLVRSPLYNPFKPLKRCLSHRNYTLENYEWQFLRQLRRKSSAQHRAFQKILKLMEDHRIIYLVCRCRPKFCHGDVIKFHLGRVRYKHVS